MGGEGEVDYEAPARKVEGDWQRLQNLAPLPTDIVHCECMVHLLPIVSASRAYHQLHM